MKYYTTEKLCIIVVVTVICGCAPKYVAKPTTPLPAKYCNTTIGHTAGSTPWIMGGTCCCTPSPELIEAYRQADLDITYEDLVEKYRTAGIVTDLDMKNTNNYDDYGPHVVKGGKSMVTPTLGTTNYEEVITGVFPEKKYQSKGKNWKRRF